MTERSRKANAPLPKGGGERFTIPARPQAPNVSTKLKTVASAVITP